MEFSRNFVLFLPELCCPSMRISLLLYRKILKPGFSHLAMSLLHLVFGKSRRLACLLFLCYN